MLSLLYPCILNKRILRIVDTQRNTYVLLKNTHICTNGPTQAFQLCHKHRDNLLFVWTNNRLEPCWRANLRNKAAVHLHCGPPFTLITMISPRYVLLSCSVKLPGCVPYGLSLRCMLGPQGKVSRWNPCILRYNRMHMFPQAQLPASCDFVWGSLVPYTLSPPVWVYWSIFGGLYVWYTW